MFTFRTRIVSGLLAAAFVVGSFGCADDSDTADDASKRDNTAQGSGESTPDAAPPATETNYVGEIDGTRSLLAVQVNGSTVNAYFCDSDQQWGFLEGNVSDGTVTARAGDTTFSGTVNRDEITGTVTIDGKAHAVALEAASGQAGIFVLDTSDGADKTTNVWIRDHDGDVAGGSFTVIAPKVIELAPLLQVQGNFTLQQQQLITDILTTGVVPAPPPSADVPTGAQPLSFTAAVRCGIAAIKFRQAQASARRSIGFGSGVINAEELQAATDGLAAACNLSQAMGCVLTSPAQLCVTTQ